MRKILLVAILAVSCTTNNTVNGDGNVLGNGNGPSALPSPTVAPSPSASPTATPTSTPATDPCLGLASLPAAAKCVALGDQRFGAFLHTVQASVAPVPSEAVYVASVVAAVKKAGVCAVGGVLGGVSADEVALRVDNTRLEVYDVFNRDGIPQLGIYICTYLPSL